MRNVSIGQGGHHRYARMGGGASPPPDPCTHGPKIEGEPRIHGPKIEGDHALMGLKLRGTTHRPRRTYEVDKNWVSED